MQINNPTILKAKNKKINKENECGLAESKKNAVSEVMANLDAIE